MPNYAFAILLYTPQPLTTASRLDRSADATKVQNLFTAITALTEVVPGQEDMYCLKGHTFMNSKGLPEDYVCQAFVFCAETGVHPTIRTRIDDGTYRIPCQRIYMIGNRQFASVDEFVGYAKQQIGEQGVSHVWGSRSPVAIRVDTTIPASPVPLANFIPVAEL